MVRSFWSYLPLALLMFYMLILCISVVSFRTESETKTLFDLRAKWILRNNNFLHIYQFEFEFEFQIQIVVN